jgi:hypothetical protein
MRERAVLSWAKVGVHDVDERHLAAFGRGFRKIGSYVKLAQVGARDCLAAADPARVAGNIGIFLGTGLGNTEISVPLAEGVLHAERPWCSPMGFAASVGNAASYNVARALNLSGLNVTISQEELSFEAALMEAALAVESGLVEQALVGGVDVYTERPAEHRGRLDAEGLPGEPAGGAAWLLLGSGDARVVLEDVLVGAGADREPGDATVFPGWRLVGMEGARVAPVETRLFSVAAAVRLVEVLDGGEPVARPGRVAFVHRTRRGTGARMRFRLT